ncbi:sensor histidine kinase [Nocardiopsis sp. HNM0947]|uniref:Oxygen sensor histidine kinase NreB n=1 Tax=Nocardiopsis coralli TaxID=2772213 RepID=A0ABR9PAM0_9ACTN|nr:sensor histidine kinase [Nocardiopsis coralli]MBE3000886.1 sensor histidine kinase [Nocardiopsis coralli]
MRYGDPPGVDTVLWVLRLLLHASFLFLLAFGLVQYTLTEIDAPVPDHPRWTHWAITAGAFLLGLLYMAGSVLARPGAPRARALVWLAAVTALWALLAWAGSEFVWVAFPLYFLHLNLLRGIHSVVAVVVITASVVAGQVLHTGDFSAGMVLGPILGAAFAVAIAIGYRALDHESWQRLELIDTLTRTRDELAESQRRTGILDERQRLSREIHDTLAQGLSSIVLLLRSAESALPDEPGVAATRVVEARESASANLEEARRFVRDLAPPSLAGGDLPEALRRLCERGVGGTGGGDGGSGGGVDCRFRLDGAPVRLPSEYDVALLRAAQASLGNVAAHARATTAVVTLGYLDDQVTLDVYDDGIGFRPEEVRSRSDGTGYGLAALRERVTALGGRLDVESAPGEGTAVAVRLPLTREESP